MFDMATDSGLFATRAALLEKGFKLEGNVFVKGEEKWLPLYEAKMVWQYDHRFGSYESVTSRGNTHLVSTPDVNYSDVHHLITPWYWVSLNDVLHRTSLWKHTWLLGWRDITNSTNRRTLISCLIPLGGCGDKFLLLFADGPIKKMMALYGQINSIVCDYLVRNKLGGTSLKYFILRQIPILPPSHYSELNLHQIIPKIIELTYTAWDLEGFAQDILKEIGEEAWNTWFPSNPVHGGKVDPFIWDEERRFILQRELDAIYAHLYGISRDDLAYILDTFPIVRKNDETKYGYFRTKEDVLSLYDKFQI
ncbi:MAG TPA: hypothetical protein O0Y07_04585 [Methanocorpusculum sp.]|nr:hypothetical protein [Methanocorpusculum sp.]